jgi:diphthamide biosynthesis protein 2
MSGEPSSSSARSAPQLMFDDGSRVMTENSSTAIKNLSLSNPRGNTSIRDYYEIDSLSLEIGALDLRNGRVAVQFPDEMLCDAPHVCWEFERTLGEEVLVFCLGDTTYAPCCPDQVAAAHLQADCLVHYGHACLSPCRQIPVLYSFGKTEFAVDVCAEAVLKQAKVDGIDRLLVLYEVQYAHAVEDLRSRLSDQDGMQILVGQIPQPAQSAIPSECSRTDCCSSTTPKKFNDEGSSSLIKEEVAADATEPAQSALPSGCSRTDCCSSTAPTNVDDDACSSLIKEEVAAGATDSVPEPSSLRESLVVGGLEMPQDIDLSDYALLFVGSDSCRQYLNIILRFLSGSGPKLYWTWRPKENHLALDLSSAFQRKLNRRFYLVQKAKECAVFGILVANLSDTNMRSVVTSLRQLLERQGKTSYTFVVGKINPAKLANFAEIDCFVLVACPEHALLEDDREFPTPVITPLELSMALGLVEWGTVQYSLDTLDYLALASSSAKSMPHKDDNAKGDDDDAPYFSLVTGRYVSVAAQEEVATDLSELPGQGQLMAYNSAAANFLKQREYQGLEVKAGSTEVHAAVEGQQGIASDYGER